jgi:outer membrane protein OmpA-like peptidoglycan-associated protein
MTGKQLDEFKKTLLKIIRKQNPIVKWRISRLEVTFRGATYLFYSIHLFRISILITIFIALIAFLVWRFSEEKLEIVWTNGQIYSRSAGEIDWEKGKETIFSADALIRIGDGEPENQEKKSESAVHSATSSRKNHFAVLKYPPSEIVILSQKGSIRREKRRENSTAYQFTGAAHLLLQPRREKPPHRWLINGFEFFTEAAHLFFQDLTSPAELTVVTGAIAIYPQQDLFLSIADEIQPKSGKIVLTSKHSIQINKETIDLKHKNDSVVQFFEDTFLPGFTTEGDFQQIGYAIVEAGGFVLKRHSNSYHVRIKTTPLMLHDVITTGLNDKVVLKLHTNDLMRLYANGEIAIREFTLPEKYPLLPLIIGVNAQESINGNQADFQIAGKVRAVINPQIKNRRFRLRSANAVVGVKGTDFEANVSGEMTEVLTVIGAVDLSDKDEKKSVTIYRGMMSHIRENQPPVQPTEIPKERMLILLKESLDTDDRLLLSSFNTIDPGHLILETGSPVSLYWNNGLWAAEVILNDRIYPLNVTRDSVELIIDQAAFNGVEPKAYKAKIKVVDTKKRIATIDTELDIRPQVKVTEDRIVFSEKIQFEKGRSIIKSESFNLLNEIIRAIKANQQIRLISIEGHTDSDGSEEYNRELSENRAEAVKHYLVQHGISKNSIQAKGFGESKPIASNTNDLEKMKNRRVEFFIQTKVPEQN